MKSKTFTCALTRAMNSRSQRARMCNFVTCSSSCFCKRRKLSLDADVGDATPWEGDEKLPKVIGLKLLNVQEASLEQDNIAQLLRSGSEWT